MKREMAAKARRRVFAALRPSLLLWILCVACHSTAAKDDAGAAPLAAPSASTRAASLIELVRLFKRSRHAA